MWRTLFPDMAVASAADMDFLQWKSRGIRAVIFDIDNTLAVHGGPPAEGVKEMFLRLDSLDMAYMLLSNNGEARVQAFAEQVGAAYIHKGGKPLPGGYRRAMESLGAVPSQVLMVGDQLFTDIWGAKALGMATCLVRPIHPAEEWQIRLKRLAEKPILAAYARERGRLWE